MRVLDVSWVHKELAPNYSHTGPTNRPGADDPDADRRYVFAIRSERRICGLGRRGFFGTPELS